MKAMTSFKESEYGTDHQTHTLFVGCRQMIIIQAADILYMNQFEYVMNTGTYFHIRNLRVHHIAGIVEDTVGTIVSREHHQLVVLLVHFQERIVLVGQLPPQAFHTEEFTPFQLLDQRDTIEKFSLHIPRHQQ